ncbi:MAG: hypothetical protein HFI75_09675 [Lachnospiraceae bacterium]|nr:hypothetical protein [Lachnospiraceae bacterium]
MIESMRDGAGTSTANASVSSVRTEWVYTAPSRVAPQERVSLLSQQNVGIRAFFDARGKKLCRTKVIGNCKI